MTKEAEATTAEAEEQGTGKEKPVKAKKMEFEHLKLIEEEKINQKDLPKEIKNKMGGIRLSVTRYNKNPNEGLYNSIRKQDVEVANEIQTWLEKDIQTENEEQKKQREETEVKEKQEQADAEAKALKEKEEKEAEEKERAENKDYDLEKKIRASIANNQITEKELSLLLGRKVKKFNGEETIGKLKLKNKWLTEIWEVVP